MDNCPMGRTHWWVLGLVAAGYFCDVIDYTILGALIPDMVNSKFMTQEQGGLIGTATLLGLFIGALGQGEFTDRYGRKAATSSTSCCSAWRRSPAPGRRATIGWWLPASSPGSASAPSSRCASRTPPNTRPSASAGASSP